MMLRTLDPAQRVSPELSEILESRANFTEALDLVTLGSVRAALAQGRAGQAYDADRLHPDTVRTLLTELDELIDEYGGEAPAADFVAATASEGLSRVLEAVIDDQFPKPPNLGSVQAAIQSGLLARLVGEGAIEPDEDATLPAELEELIHRYGPNTPAEYFLHYE
jgi:hypothetical protein